MEELENLNIKIPVIFSDGCTVNNLMRKSKSNPNNYFVSAINFGEENEENLAPTYNPVGIDAQTLSSLIISNISGNITRESVAEYITKIRKENIQMMDNGANGSKYQFNANGDNMSQDMKWRVYSYINDNLEKVYEGI